MRKRYLASLILAAVAVAPAHGQPAKVSCDTPEHKQFDFWVGSWDVYRTDTDKLVARSLIEKLYNGCAVRENWMPLGGTGGGSLNAWRPAEKMWVQTWTDSSNRWNEYRGGLENANMVLTGTSVDPAGGKSLVRMTFEPKPDGSVVQTGHGSNDGGKTWSVQYQFHYRPAASPSA